MWNLLGCPTEGYFYRHALHECAGRDDRAARFARARVDDFVAKEGELAKQP